MKGTHDTKRLFTSQSHLRHSKDFSRLFHYDYPPTDMSSMSEMWVVFIKWLRSIFCGKDVDFAVTCEMSTSQRCMMMTFHGMCHNKIKTWERFWGVESKWKIESYLKGEMTWNNYIKWESFNDRNSKKTCFNLSKESYKEWFFPYLIFKRSLCGLFMLLLKKEEKKTQSHKTPKICLDLTQSCEV